MMEGSSAGDVCVTVDGVARKSCPHRNVRGAEPRGTRRLPCEQLGKSHPGGRSRVCGGTLMCWKNVEKLCGLDCSEQGESRTRPTLERWAEAGPVVPKGAILPPRVHWGYLCVRRHRFSEWASRIQDSRQCVTLGCLNG